MTALEFLLAEWATWLQNRHDICMTEWPFGEGRGRPKVRLDGVNVSAARVMCRLLYGVPAPGSLAVHGPCHNPACYNPRHLGWGTPTSNALDRLRDGTLVSGTDYEEIAALWTVDEPVLSVDKCLAV